MSKLRHWDAVLTPEEMEIWTKDLALFFASRLGDKELADQVADKLSAKDWLWFCEVKPNYGTLSVSDCATFLQILALFQKRADIDLKIDREKAALVKFNASELHCRSTNETFKLWAAGKVSFLPGVERVLFNAQRKIANCLGGIPPIEQFRCRFGPGATTQVIKRMASPRSKLGQTFACSEDLAPTIGMWLEEVPGWIPFPEDSTSVKVTVEIHPGLLSFVPKNAKTDRSIAVEPSLNSFFQLGVGDYIAERLRLKGVDIRDQSRNQQLAQIASLHGELATLDLSSASDTIARELVAHLLPIDWFLMLDSLRTGTLMHEGIPVKLQKFSSMGNGFTFPLETLIFWALASASAEECRGGQVSVYGDDIIVPVSCVPTLQAVLHACGFLLNTEKSFWSGPFRESCGKDYHSGILVRPAFIKDRLSGEAIFIMHNFFVRNGDFETAHYLRNWIDPDIQLFGPDGYGDGHLLRVPGEIGNDLTPCNRDREYAGYTFETFTWKGRKTFRPYPGDHVYPSYTIYVKEPRLQSEVPPLADPLVAMLAKVGSSRFRQLYGDSAFEKIVKSLQGLQDMSHVHHKKSGLLGNTLPGVQGYKRIRIYTLTV